MRQSGVTYRHFTNEEIEKANNVDIVRVAEDYGYQIEKSGQKALHLKNSGGLYLFPDGNKFYHHTADDAYKKGGTINFVMHMEHLAFGEAVAKLLGVEYEIYQTDSKPYVPKLREPMVLPEKAANFKRAYWYLASVRGIDTEIISIFMNEKKVFQEAKYGNVAFVGYDRDGAAKYCSMRATYTNSSFKRDADNSDKSYPFFYEGQSDLVIVNESPIDLMSHATLTKIAGSDWRQDHRVSVGCLSLGALDRYLEWHPEIKRLVFAFDNDYLARNQQRQLCNWGQIAVDKAIDKYSHLGFQCAAHVPHLKDFNQDLIEIRKGRTPAELDTRREREMRENFEKYAERESDVEENEDDLEL